MTPPCLLPAPYWVLSWQHNCVLEEPRAATSYYVAFGKEPQHERSEWDFNQGRRNKVSFAVWIHPQFEENGGNYWKMNDIAPFLGIHGFSSFRRKVFIHRNVFIEVLMAAEIQGSNHQSFRSCSEMTRVMLLTLVIFKHSSLSNCRLADMTLFLGTTLVLPKDSDLQVLVKFTHMEPLQAVDFRPLCGHNYGQVFFSDHLRASGGLHHLFGLAAVHCSGLTGVLGLCSGVLSLPRLCINTRF